MLLWSVNFLKFRIGYDINRRWYARYGLVDMLNQPRGILQTIAKKY